MIEAVEDWLSERGFLLGAAVGAALVALVVLVTWVLVYRAGRSRRTDVRQPGPPAGPAPSSPSDSDSAERRVLVDGLADLALRLPAGLDREAVGILARAGVHRRAADGLRFDPEWQDALGSEPATDPATEGTVVRTLRDFFDDRGRPASRPQVVVLARGVSGTPGSRTGAPGEPAGPAR